MFRTIATSLRLRAQPLARAPVFFRSFSEDSQAGSNAGNVAGRDVGTVKWFDSAKGFGFITRSTGQDVFVHFSGIAGAGFRSLEEGQKVQFTVTKGAKGLQAVEVTLNQ